LSNSSRKTILEGKLLEVILHFSVDANPKEWKKVKDGQKIIIERGKGMEEGKGWPKDNH